MPKKGHNRTKIGISIIAYNAPHELERCILSCLAQSYPDFLVLVRDHSHSDYWEQNETICKQHPQVVYVNPKENGGFVKHDQNTHLLLQYGCSAFFLLNQDAYFIENTTLSELECVSKSVNNEVIAQPIHISADRKIIINAGNAVSYTGFGGQVQKYISRVYTSTELFEPSYVMGAALFFTSKVYKKLGYLFPEENFMYGDDIDLCLRARLLSIPQYVVPGSIICHDFQFLKSENKFYFMDRSRYFFLLSYYSAFELIIMSPALLLSEVLVYTFEMMQGWHFKRKVFISIWQNRKVIRRRRVERKTLIRTGNAKSFYSFLVPKISGVAWAHTPFRRIILRCINFLFALNWLPLRIYWSIKVLWFESGLLFKRTSSTRKYLRSSKFSQ